MAANLIKLGLSTAITAHSYDEAADSITQAFTTCDEETKGR